MQAKTGNREYISGLEIVIGKSVVFVIDIVSINSSFT
jgi:hypothetical protein